MGRVTHPISAQTMEKCRDSKTCLCDGIKGSAREVRILGYKLFDDNESFVIKVKAG